MNALPEARRRAWHNTFVTLALAMAVIAYGYRDTLAAMAEIWWRSDTYAHGFLVPLISGWLVWRSRHRIASLSPSVWLWPLIPLGIMVFTWLLGDLTAVNALTQFAVVAIVVLTCMTLLGRSLSKQLAFPLFFLFFAVPIGDFLMPKLMEWTADFTVIALRGSGIPVYREGQNFVVPSGNWSVVEACSGIRYLIASLTVGTLYAYLTYSSLKRRLVFVAVSILVPIVANWLRAYMIVMLGHLSGNKLAVGVDHLIYGWIFFGIVVAIMFAIGTRWAEAEPAPTPSTQPISSATLVGRDQQLWLSAILIVCIVAAGPVARKVLHETNDKPAPVFSLSQAVAPWHNVPHFIDLHPHFSKPSAEMHEAFQSGDERVGLYIAYYRNQDFDRKLITSTNALVTPSTPEWQLAPTGNPISEGNSPISHVKAYELSRKFGVSDERYVAWQWYWINGRITSSDIMAKILTAASMLGGQGDDAAVIIVYAPKASAGSSLAAFTRDMADVVHRSLAEARTR